MALDHHLLTAGASDLLVRLLSSLPGGYARVLIINTANPADVGITATTVDANSMRVLESLERWKRDVADMAKLMRERVARERCPPTPVNAWHRRRPQESAAVRHKTLLRPPRCACQRYLSLNEKRMAWGFK